MSNINIQEIEFAQGKISSIFRKYAFAGALGLLFVGMQTMIDGAFLGRFVGADALASVNIAMPVYTLITAIAIVIGIGCQTVVGISLGEGERQKASNAVKSAFIALLFITSFIAFNIYLFSSDIIALLGDDPTLLESTKSYLITLCPFYPFIALFFLADYMLKSFGKPYYAMCVLTCTVILNIVLDYLFIVVLGFGVTGAAYATGIAFSTGALSIIHILFKNPSNVTVQKGRFNFKLLANMLYNGSSEGLSELSAGITILMFNNAMIFYAGADGVAAYTFVNYLLYAGVIIFVGISDGIIPILSYNYGANNMKRVFALFKFGIVVNFLIGVVIALIAYFGGSSLSSFFFDSSKDAHVLEIAAIGAKVCAFAFLMNGANICISGFFTSMGNAKMSIIISMLRGLILIAIGIFIFPRLFGVNGIWLTIPVAEFITLLVGIYLVKRRLR